MKYWIRLALVIVISNLFVVACGEVGKRKTVPGPKDKVYSVSITKAIKKEVPNSIQMDGRFIPLSRLEIKSDFTGKIQALSVEEGQNVLSGDALLKIEDEKLPWILERQRTELREAEAQLDFDNKRGAGGAGSDALEDSPDEEEDEEPEDDEGQEEDEEPEDSAQDSQDNQEDENEDDDEESPFNRLARLRQRAQRARRTALARARTRRRTANQALIPQNGNQENPQVSESRGVLNQAKVDRIRAEVSLTEKQVEGSTLSSGIDGVITKVNIAEGSLVKPMDVLMLIVTVDPIDLSLKIPKNEVYKIDKKMKVRVRTPDLGGQSFDGEISFIGAEIEKDQKTVEVRIRVNNPKLKIKVGMEGIAQIAIQKASHQAVLVPENALVQAEGKTYVYVQSGQVAKRVEVTTGSKLEGWVEIKSGIKANEAIISQGAEQLKEPSEFIKVKS